MYSAIFQKPILFFGAILLYSWSWGQVLILDATDKNEPLSLKAHIRLVPENLSLNNWEDIYQSKLDEVDPSFATQNGQTLWLRMDLQGSSINTDSYIFQVSSDLLGKHSWNYVNAWLIRTDGTVDSQQTGILIPKNQKPFPHPLNLLSFEIGKNEVVCLIVKLAGYTPERIPEEPNIYLVPKGYYKDIHGVYHFEGGFSIRKENTPVATNWLFHQEIYEDPDYQGIAFIHRNWEQLDRKDIFEVSPQPNMPYWLRARVLSSPYLKGNAIFQLTEFTQSDNYNRMGFDSVQVFITTDSLIRELPATGNHIRPIERPWKHWAQYVKLDIPQADTVDVFFRVKGADKRLLPKTIQLLHIDESTMWDWQVNEGLLHGLFYGILIIQFCYFLLLFGVEKEPLHAYLSILVFGLLLIFGFGASARFIILPYWRNFHLLLFRSGFFVSILALLMFTQAYFPSNRKSSLFPYILPSYLLIHALVCLINSFPWGFLPQNTILVTSLVGLVLNFIMVVKAGKPSTSLKSFYLLAFLPLFLLMIIYAIEALLSTYGIITEGFALGFDLYNGMKISIVLMLILLALSAGSRTNRLKAEKTEALRKGLEDQERINQAISRFVPNEFLSSLNKKDLTQIVLGDNIQKEVTVLFTDIRSYTTLAESMSPEENFRFVNAYNGRMGPIIRKHSGFVNQYLGDGIMAIFPEATDDALQAAIQMQKELMHYNEQRQKNHKPPIKVGMGLHSGLLIMGIIGDEQRMDAATISDTVNTASRVEGLSKYFGASILLSEASLEKLDHPESFHVRFLGKVEVKGKTRPIGVLECFDGDPPEIFNKKKDSLSLFNAGTAAYFERSFEKAIEHLNKVLYKNPQDLPAQLILKKAIKYQKEGIAPDWTGVEVAKQK